jgi:hypothetical protein
VISKLRIIGEPSVKLNFGTKNKNIPLSLVGTVTSLNRKKIPILLAQLATNATTCQDLEQYRELVRGHADQINQLVAANRKSAIRHSKEKKVSKKVLHDSKYALYRRLAVWRDAVNGILKLLTAGDQEWTATRRNFLWRRLLNTNQLSWYGYNLPETFPMSCYLDD